MILWRDATADDAAALAAIGAQSFTETFGHLYAASDLAVFLATHRPENWARELADPAYAVRIGSSEGADIAYAKLGPPVLPFALTRPAIELRQFYVLAPHQGTGVAAAMMEWVLSAARARGAAELYLSVFVDNHRAQRFYARYGFEWVADHAFMVGNHADTDHILRLTL